MDANTAARAVDRLFERFALRWAKSFLKEYEGLDVDKVKAEWIDELMPFTIEQVAHAFDALKNQTFAPSLPTFCAYCKAARPAAATALPNKFTPEQLAENRENIRRIKEKLAAAKRMPVT